MLWLCTLHCVYHSACALTDGRLSVQESLVVAVPHWQMPHDCMPPDPFALPPSFAGPSLLAFVGQTHRPPAHSQLPARQPASSGCHGALACTDAPKTAHHIWPAGVHSGCVSCATCELPLWAFALLDGLFISLPDLCVDICTPVKTQHQQWTCIDRCICLPGYFLRPLQANLAPASTASLAATLALVALCGVCDGLAQGALFGEVALLPPKYTQALVAGTAASCGLHGWLADGFIAADDCCLSRFCTLPAYSIAHCQLRSGLRSSPDHFTAACFHPCLSFLPPTHICRRGCLPAASDHQSHPTRHRGWAEA
jgi:hypothetical protein